MSGDWLKSGRMLACCAITFTLAGWGSMGLALEPLPEEASAVAAVKARGNGPGFHFKCLTCLKELLRSWQQAVF